MTNYLTPEGRKRLANWAASGGRLDTMCTSELCEAIPQLLAENERLRMEPVGRVWQIADEVCAERDVYLERLGEFEVEVHTLRTERDALKAEVERLRERIEELEKRASRDVRDEILNASKEATCTCQQQWTDPNCKALIHD